MCVMMVVLMGEIGCGATFKGILQLFVLAKEAIEDTEEKTFLTS